MHPGSIPIELVGGHDAYHFRNVEDAKQRLCESRAFRQTLFLEAWGHGEWAPKTARAKALDAKLESVHARPS